MKRDAICQSEALIYLTDSNASRTPFEIDFKAFELPIRKARRRSNFFECVRMLSKEEHCRSPAMPKPPPASTRNPAFQSKLEPYREFIRECRAKRWSYPRIAAALWEDHGLSVAPSTIFSFVKVRAKRRRLYALPPSDEPRVFQSVQVNSRAREFFSPPEPETP